LPVTEKTLVSMYKPKPKPNGVIFSNVFSTQGVKETCAQRSGYVYNAVGSWWSLSF